MSRAAAGTAARELSCRVLDSVDQLEAASWDRLAGDSNPFLRHAFLAALEHGGCVDPEHGWQPHHLALFDADVLIGAMPAYLKGHSFGEFVFDWSWAEAYERAGEKYYPKLLCAVPFTPATGPRLLSAPGTDHGDVVRALVSASIQLAERAGLSSAHWLFTRDEDDRALRALPLLERHGCQYHWHNPGFGDFDDYLASLNSKRRKQVRKERREAAAAPVEVEVRHGHELSEGELAGYHRLYCSTYDRKWGFPSLSLEFFFELAERMPRELVLILAKRNGRCVAGAHLLRGADALFGRNWGCSEWHRSLHFEMCYYRAIEYCIAEGLALFEAGAQGEHKIARGFVPTLTRSHHWIADPRFRAAIDDFIGRERREIASQIAQLSEHVPLHRPPPAAAAAR